MIVCWFNIIVVVVVVVVIYASAWGGDKFFKCDSSLQQWLNDASKFHSGDLFFKSLSFVMRIFFISSIIFLQEGFGIKIQFKFYFEGGVFDAQYKNENYFTTLEGKYVEISHNVIECLEGIVDFVISTMK